MTSVFTYDPSPPRVSSPWLQPADAGTRQGQPPSPAPGASAHAVASPTQPGLLSDYGVTKLEAEPQDGPTEYKLHLLLRQRRQFRYMSTTDRIAGSQQPRPNATEQRTPKLRGAVAMASSSQTRQARLLQLTTQLFWRLRQSSPYHASVANQELVIPQLADDASESSVGIKPGKPLPGLEESRGALYEIGVADDGTLVGLTEDEMAESIATLRIMAASLGCTIDVLRRVIVGDCEWRDDSPLSALHKGELWVAEVLVLPNLGSSDEELGSTSAQHQTAAAKAEPSPTAGPSTTDQLRVTLTGPTTSGKSTLLGTLSTGTLDNGHGKSRLSLLRHRHELASGVTSSVAQELIGYNGQSIVNYSNPNIEAWIGIHDFTEAGRLVFVSDSAGHPRFRRTILRGIVGWAPHWTLLCIAADDEDTAAHDFPGESTGVDLASAHLALCLRLQIPLAVVITKFDKATNSVRRTLSKVLSSIKDSGRTPRMLQPDQSRSDAGLGRIPQEDADRVARVVADMADAPGGNMLGIVPIVMTSAVKGTGIGLVHALLAQLPLPPLPTAQDLTGPVLNPEQPNTLFHIDDKFSLPASHISIGGTADHQADPDTIVSGYVRFGKLSVGDKVVLGPFPSEEDDENRGLTPEGRQSPASNSLLSRSHPSATELSRIASRSAMPASAIKGEWRSARVVSIRNLRLPVLTLQAGQVGTIGLVVGPAPAQEKSPVSAAIGSGILSGSPRRPSQVSAAGAAQPKIRTGMVLAMPSRHMLDTGLSLQAASGLTASFRDPAASSLVVGGLVNVYVASVRAAARILRVSAGQGVAGVMNDDVFDLDGINAEDAGGRDNSGKSSTSGPSEEPVQGAVDVKLELLTNREWIEMGSRIVILEGGGLEGFVGTVVEIVD